MYRYTYIYIYIYTIIEEMCKIARWSFRRWTWWMLKRTWPLVEWNKVQISSRPSRKNQQQFRSFTRYLTWCLWLHWTPSLSFPSFFGEKQKPKKTPRGGRTVASISTRNMTLKSRNINSCLAGGLRLPEMDSHRYDTTGDLRKEEVFCPPSTVKAEVFSVEVLGFHPGFVSKMRSFLFGMMMTRWYIWITLASNRNNL